MVGFILSLLAGAIVAPFGEEILFRGFATTAWVRGIGARRGLIRGALFFAFAHVLTIAARRPATRSSWPSSAFWDAVPVALALGWLFLRRGTIWASFGLHAAFNGDPADPRRGVRRAGLARRPTPAAGDAASSAR